MSSALDRTRSSGPRRSCQDVASNCALARTEAGAGWSAGAGRPHHWRRPIRSSHCLRPDALAGHQHPDPRQGGGGEGRPVAFLRSHAHAAQPEGFYRARSRYPESHLSVVARGAVRKRGLGKSRPDTARSVGRISALVQARGGLDGAQRLRTAGDRARDGWIARRHGAAATAWSKRFMRGKSCWRPARKRWATGSIPESLRHLPARLIARASDPIDFEALAGRTVAVIGAGATAFDNAATALEAGAAEVHLLCRRAEIQLIQPYRWLTFRGFLRHFCDLDDVWRWRFMRAILELREGFPQATYDRCARFANFHLHEGSPVEAAHEVGERGRIADASRYRCGRFCHLRHRHRYRLRGARRIEEFCR